jgi:hypothetical protein
MAAFGIQATLWAGLGLLFATLAHRRLEERRGVRHA